MNEIKTFDKTLNKMKKDQLINLVKALSVEIYISDVVGCGMKKYIIGEGKDYQSVDDWKISMISDYYDN